MLASGMPDFYADYVVDLNRFYRTGAVARLTGDVKAVTGHDPIPFEQFARDHGAAFR